MIANQPLISVIIPVYNGAKTIYATVNSALRQSHQALELIVINDGSTDETLTVLEQITDPRLQVLSFKNAGVATSRNRGMAAAQGDYISFLDADDLWTDDKLADQLDALQRNPNADVAYSWTDYIDQADQCVRAGWHRVENGDVYAQLVQCCFIENGSNILFHRKVLDRIEGFDNSVVPLDDWDFYLRLAENFQFVCVPKAQILYRMSTTSQSTKVLEMERSGITVLQRTFTRSAQKLSRYQSQSFANYYGYLFYKAWLVAHNRQSRWLALTIFARGMWASPKLFKQIATRRILQLCWGLTLKA